MTQKSSVFVKIDNYREVLDLTDQLKRQLVAVRRSYEELERLRDEEQKGIDAWKSHLDAVESQLQDIDQTLFEPE